MPAKVAEIETFGWVEIKLVGFVRKQDWVKFIKAGFEWHYVTRAFTKPLNQANVKEAHRLAEEYNNRFNEAA